MSTPTNLSLAQAARIEPIDAIAERAGLAPDDFEPLGRTKGKLTWEGVARLKERSSKGRLVLVTAVTPTPHGEGKTTVSVGLAQGLNRIGRSAVPALREPALGPIFGTKGGACGGGKSQVLPMEEINLFFNGDFPAIAAAHNLLSAMLDAHIHHGNKSGLDLRRATWPRTVDMNDRALREVVVGLGGFSNGTPRSDGFVITPASEVMAILCLANSLENLKERLDAVIVGQKRDGTPVRAADLGATGAMTVLLKDALRPNLVQTMEGGAALIHGGPFANIAHGCSSVLGTQCALGLAEFCVTEAGFASDLGAEKFMHIAAPGIGRHPDAIVLVATVRALKHHGDGDLQSGLANLRRHIQHLRRYGPPVVCTVNRFAADTQEEIDSVLAAALDFGACAAAESSPWLGGGDGCTGLAEEVARLCGEPGTSAFAPLYGAEGSLRDRIAAVVRGAHGGAGAAFSEEAEKKLEWADKHGYGGFPVCIAKTQLSLSDNPSLKNAPEGFTVHIRDIKVSAGAGFAVALAGEMMLMPGLGKTPAALSIGLDEDGRITGMF